MKAIIMAGGEGTRLRPLTCDCPKPMIRLMNRPVMQYALELLKRHGITQVAATLGYQPDAIIDCFGDGEAFGVDLRCTIEKTPLGTAGGVRQAADFLDERFVVLSGDGVTDLDLSDAIAFHRRKRALATLVLRRADNPLDYGVVSADPDGRVLSFHEKPGWSDVVSDTVNTGIYILEPEVLSRIPEGRACDFGHDLFPALVREGLPVFGYVMQGYWCDIGDVRAYLAAHVDALEGRIHLEGLLPKGSRAVQLPGATVDRAAVLEGPCLIGRNARVLAGAYVGPYSVVGENCVIGEGASVKRSVLWSGVRLEAGAQARGCVLAANAVLGPNAQAYEESVLGTGARAGSRAVLAPGIKLWPGKQVADGERLSDNRVWGGCSPARFDAGRLSVDSPASAARTLQSIAAALKPREILLGRAEGPVADALWHAAASGAMAQGVQVLDAGVCVLPVLRCAQQSLSCEAAALVDAAGLIPLNALGARLTTRQQRAVLAQNARQDCAAPFSGETPALRAAGGCDVAWIARTAGLFQADARMAPPVALYAQNPTVLSLAERAFLRAGLSVRAESDAARMVLAPQELGFCLSDDGERVHPCDERGALNEAERQLLIAWTALESGLRTLLLPAHATRAIEALCNRYDARVEYVAGESSLWMNRVAERCAELFGMCFDGCAGALSTLSALTNAGMSLAQWREAMPRITRRSRSVPVPAAQTGRVLQAMARRQSGAELGGGLRFTRGEGWAWICPDERRPEFRIVAESASAEFARELCCFCEDELKRLIAKE